MGKVGRKYGRSRSGKIHRVSVGAGPVHTIETMIYTDGGGEEFDLLTLRDGTVLELTCREISEFHSKKEFDAGEDPVGIHRLWSLEDPVPPVCGTPLAEVARVEEEKAKAETERDALAALLVFEHQESEPGTLEDLLERFYQGWEGELKIPRRQEEEEAQVQSLSLGNAIERRAAELKELPRAYSIARRRLLEDELEALQEAAAARRSIEALENKKEVE
jgi:hypothetical protein